MLSWIFHFNASHCGLRYSRQDFLLMVSLTIVPKYLKLFTRCTGELLSTMYLGMFWWFYNSFNLYYSLKSNSEKAKIFSIIKDIPPNTLYLWLTRRCSIDNVKEGWHCSFNETLKTTISSTRDEKWEIQVTFNLLLIQDEIYRQREVLVKDRLHKVKESLGMV